MHTWACLGVIAVSVLSILPQAAGFIAPTSSGSRLLGVPARATACQGSRSRRGAGLRSAGRSLHGLRCSETGDSGGKAEGTPELVDPATLAFADGLKEHLAGIWGPTGAFLCRCVCIMNFLCDYAVCHISQVVKTFRSTRQVWSLRIRLQATLALIHTRRRFHY